MKVYRILLAAGAAALLLLAGCTREMKTAAVSDEGEVPMQGFDASMSYDYRMEYITGGVPKQVMDKINNHIIRYDILYDEDETSVDVPAACRQWADGQVSTYEADASEFAEDFDEDDAWMFNWSFSIDGSFETACKERGWQTYATASEDYTGGAHGSYFLSYTGWSRKRISSTPKPRNSWTSSTTESSRILMKTCGTPSMRRPIRTVTSAWTTRASAGSSTPTRLALTCSAYSTPSSAGKSWLPICSPASASGAAGRA